VDEYDDTSTTSESRDLDLPPHPSREPLQSAQLQGGATKEDLGEPLSELSDQLNQSRLDEEEDTQTAAEETRRGKVRRPSQRPRASQVSIFATPRRISV